MRRAAKPPLRNLGLVTTQESRGRESLTLDAHGFSVPGVKQVNTEMPRDALRDDQTPGDDICCMSQPSSAEFFAMLREGLASRADLRAEFEAALVLNLQRANPSDRGNRFIFGAGVEWVVAAACHAVGVPLVPGGHNKAGVDLILRTEDGDNKNSSEVFPGWSVKSSASPRVRDFRLSNGLGGAGQGMSAPTLFLAPMLGGIVYVDPAQHLEVSAACRSLSDATALPVAAVLQHKSAQPECFAPAHIPVNKGTDKDAENHFESYARLLMSTGKFPLLRAVFD